MTTTTRSGRGLCAVALVLALAASACSGSDDGPKSAPSASPSTGESGGPPPLATTVRVSKVTGKLSGSQRRELQKSVGEVVDRWWDAAYVGGEYPRDDFGDAFPGFTRGAAMQARGDRRLLSNDAIGERVDEVTATLRRVGVDVLAVRGKAVGVTARLRLDFGTSGELEKKFQVRGRLLLTRSEGRWRVFGYDVTKGAV